MLKVNNSFKLHTESVIKWMIQEEPELVSKIYNYYYPEDHQDVSLDTETNIARLQKVQDHFSNNIQTIYSELTPSEKFILYLICNSYGWIVYENIDATINIIARIFKKNFPKLKKSVASLFKKFIVFKFERLKRFNLLFTPPAFTKIIKPLIDKEDFTKISTDLSDTQENYSPYQYISLISGLISYVITYTPRSSESNEIHKIDFVKMVDFFKDFAPHERIESVIKKLSRFGFFEKLNNRIVINKDILEKILSLDINEQLFVVFLYQFMDKFDFKQNYFMTLKILANSKKGFSLRELFFYYMNNEIYLQMKNKSVNLRLLIQQEELKFTFFLKSLESEKIISIKKASKDKISIATDFLIMNEPHRSLLKNQDFSKSFKEKKFVIEPNYEVIVEPYLKPKILFKLAMMVEPVTIQTVSIFKITKESIYRAFGYGLRKKEILNFLKKHSLHELPENVVNGIQSFIEDLEVNKLDNHTMIQIHSQESHIIKDYFKNKVIEIEPHTFLVFDETVLTKIKDFCAEKKIELKFINDFLDKTDYFNKVHEESLDQNIKHLHAMKEFFEFYGSSMVGTQVKIDNKI